MGFLILILEFSHFTSSPILDVRDGHKSHMQGEVSSPVHELLAAHTNRGLVVVGDAHFVRAALHLQAGIFGRIKGYKKPNTLKKESEKCMQRSLLAGR